MTKRANGEGSIYQRKSDGKWVGSITLPTGQRKVFYGQKQSEVLKKVQAALHDQQEGKLIATPQQSLKSYLEHWLEDVHKPALRLSSYVKYRKLLNNHILPALGHIALDKLTPQHVQSFYSAKLKQGLSPKMVNMLHGVLHKAFDTAVKWSLMPNNVCDKVSPPRIPKTKKQVLTLVRTHQLEALLALALTTAMRRGELLALRWHEVNLETQSLQVTRTLDYIPHYGFVESEPKTEKGSRQILLAGFVVKLLKQHRHKQEEQRKHMGADWVEKDLVFPNRFGDFFSPNTLLKMFGRFLKQAGLPHLRFHDLRHSAATLLLGMGVHPKIVQEILGHSHISQTMDTYSHILPSMQREVAQKWDEEFGE